MRVWTGCFRGYAQVGAETLVLLSDALVALERWILAAGATFEHGVLATSTDDRIAVAGCAAPSALSGRDAVIRTLWILAEVGLDPAVPGRISGVEPPEDFFCTG